MINKETEKISGKRKNELIEQNYILAEEKYLSLGIDTRKASLQRREIIIIGC